MKLFQRRSATALSVMAAGLVILGISQFTWLSFEYSDVLGEHSATASGAAVSPQVAAAAVVVVAAGILLTLAGKVLQRLALAVAALAAALAAWSSFAFLSQGDELVSVAHGTLSGTFELTSEVTLSFWPWPSAIIGLSTAIWFLAALWKAPTWLRKSARYESHRQVAEDANETVRARADWDAITDGVDPSEGS